MNLLFCPLWYSHSGDFILYNSLELRRENSGEYKPLPFFICSFLPSFFLFLSFFLSLYFNFYFLNLSIINSVIFYHSSSNMVGEPTNHAKIVSV